MKKLSAVFLTLTLAAGFTAPAHAQSLGICYANYSAAQAKCGADGQCLAIATTSLDECLQALAKVDQ